MLRQASPFSSSLYQRSGRADINASTAELATYILEGKTESCAYQSLAPSIGEGDCSRPPYLLADPDTASTKNTEIIITVKESTVSLYRQAFVCIGKGYLFNPDVIDNFLQLATPILWASDTALGYCYVAQAYIQGAAALPAVTGEASMGVFT
jgi:hypothetical protein